MPGYINKTGGHYYGLYGHITKRIFLLRGIGQRIPVCCSSVTLKEKFIGTGSGNLTELENVINQQAAKGYRLHTITTANGGSKGLMGGDRIQATMVFEKVN